jgi:hypothetical protein
MSKIICNFSHLNLNPELDVYLAHERIQYYMKIYYTLLFYFPYLSLLAHPVTIFVYRPAIILDKKYNIANSSCHFGSYGSIWTGASPKKYYMDLRSFCPYNIFWWRTGPYTAIWPSVPWTICYILFLELNVQIVQIEQKLLSNVLAIRSLSRIRHVG